MKAEIITIGTELLLGQIIDTNAAFIAQQLANIGFDVYPWAIMKAAYPPPYPMRSSVLMSSLQRAD
jgi:hypothetical protein